MSYRVGIDFGTTFTAAAVHRDGEQAAELVPLGDNKAAVASVVFVAADGSLVMGEAAVRRAVTDPDRVVREVKRRIGDQTPVLVAGDPIDAHTIAACFVRWVVDRVSEREGGPPAGIALTYPASWGRHKRTLLIEALAAQQIDDVTLVTEPAAAAVAYTASQHVEPGSAICVYDLGGGTFDAAVVRQLDDGGFELVGRPEGIDSLGGVDFDEAVFDHVRGIIGDKWAELDFDDPMVRTGAAALRRECTEAKEALSADTEVTIPVMLPGVSTRVRMVRDELEQLIEPAIAATVEAVRRACESAGLTSADLSAVLLVGGSSRIPLVAQRVSAAFDRPVTVDSDPKAVVATGAALSLRPAPATPAPRTVVALPDRPASMPVMRRGRVVTVGVGIAVCLGALVATAGTVGSDLLPGGGAPVGAAEPADAGAPREVVDRVPVGGSAPGEEVDPWTGEPYRATTPPGPKRPGAKPTTASPATLTPTPTKGGDRDAQIDGAPPSTETVSQPPTVQETTGEPSVPGSTTTVEPEPTTTTTEPVPEPTTTTPEPEPTTTTTEEPPPPEPTDEPVNPGTGGSETGGSETGGSETSP